MKSKFNQKWSTIPPISTKRTITSNSLRIKMGHSHMTSIMQILQEHAQEYEGVKPGNEIPNPLFLISGSPRAIPIKANA